MNKGVFPNELKQADIKPYKKESRNEKEKLRKSLDSVCVCVVRGGGGGGGGLQLLF